MNKFLEIVNDYLDMDLTPADSLDDGGADSLDKVEIFMAIEREYNVSLSDEVMDEFLECSYLPLSEVFKKMKPHLNV